MVGIRFARPVGPFADTKELEYISALHQTCEKEIRSDGTIQARDIMYYLRSRHGVRVDKSIVRESIIMEMGGSPPVLAQLKKKEQEEKESSRLQLGGTEYNTIKLQTTQDTVGDDDDDDDDDDGPKEPGLDLCQILALLLIPYLRSGNPDGNEQERVGAVVDIALETIWAELRSHSITTKEEEEGAVLVTIDFLRDIMDLFGEFNVPDEILREMIEVAAGQQGATQCYMTKASFLQALTADTQLYNPRVDVSNSTHFNDARLASSSEQAAKKQQKRDEEDDEEKEASPNKKKDDNAAATEPFQVMYTAANVDNTADTYRSQTWFVLVWVSTVWVYLAYIAGNVQKFKPFENCTNEFGCQVALALANWSLIFVELMILGFIWIMVSNFGNTTHATETCCSKFNMSFRILLGMALVTVVTILSFWGDSESIIWNTAKNDDYIGAYYIVMIMGFAIVLNQIFRLLSLYVSLGVLTKGGQEYWERRMKQAASSKVMKFVEHASLLHVSPDDDMATIATQDDIAAAGSSSSNSLKRSTVSKSVTDISKKLHASNKKRYNSSTRSSGSSTASVLLNYNHMQDTEEETGGVFWTFKRMWDGSLFTEEGIYLHGRLLAVNAVQFLITIFMIAYCLFYVHELDDYLAPVDDDCTFRVDGILVHTELAFTGDDDTIAEFLSINWTNIAGQSIDYLEAVDQTGNNYTEMLEAGVDTVTTGGADDDLDSTLLQNIRDVNTDNFQNIFNINETHFSDGFSTFYGQFPLFNGTMFDNGAKTVCYDFYITNGTDVWTNEAAMRNSFVDALNLEKWEYTSAAAIGLLFAIFATLGIAFVYIPSFAATVLKYRAGYEPSLKGNMMTYGLYRKSPDQTAIIWGSAFWGILFSAGICFALFGGIAFLFIYSETRQFLGVVVAQYIGIFATIMVKVLVMMVLRKTFYAGGFYRKRPAASNIMNVILEAWYLGLSIGTVTSRTIKLFVVTCFYIGRIDTHMLAPGVGYIGSSPLDAAPDAFRKDLLIHEAHRHPFIERLGMLYLLKLYNGKAFGNRAGAYWRLLFVLTVFPWMRNYRVSRNLGSLLLDVEEDLTEYNNDDDDDNNNLTKRRGSNVRIAENVWDPADSIVTLAAKRRALKNQLRDLNSLLSHKLKDEEGPAMNAFERNKMMESARLDTSFSSRVST